MSGNLAVTWLPLLGGVAFKSLIIFALAGTTLLALRRASASTRHLICLLTLAALLALPILSLALPGWRLAVPLIAAPAVPAPMLPSPLTVKPPTSAGTGTQTKVVPFAPPSARLAPLLVLPPSGAAAPRLFPWAVVLLIFWFFGALLAGSRPLLGLWGIARLSQDSPLISDVLILAMASDCTIALRLYRTPLMRQGQVSIPMTWGWRHPVVLLPTGAQTWPEVRLRAVLLHELAHVRRSDWISHRFADFVCAIYWFHPLVWLTARRLRIESEIACDDLVLSSGVAAPDYARHLLDVARALRPTAAVPQAVIAMARTSHIEGRLKMILDNTRSRRSLTRRSLLTVLALSAAVLVPLAVLRPGARAQAAAPLAASHRILDTIHLTDAPTASYSGGVPVQLVGIGSLKTLKWWDRNGAPLVQPVYAISPFLFSSEAPNLSQRHVVLAFQLPAAAQDITVKYALSNSLNSSSDGSWRFKVKSGENRTEAQLNERTGGARVVTVTFPANTHKTNVRVGTASGSWNVIGIVRRDASGQMEGLNMQRGNTGYIFSPLAETKEGTVLTVSLNTATASAAEDLRIVAVDGQGRQLLPDQIGDSSIGALDQITARFALPSAQISAMRLESRPFRYIEFKNVPLQPTK